MGAKRGKLEWDGRVPVRHQLELAWELKSELE